MIQAPVRVQTIRQAIQAPVQAVTHQETRAAAGIPAAAAAALIIDVMRAGVFSSVEEAGKQSKQDNGQ